MANTISLAASEQRVVLQNISWHTFENILNDLGDQPSPRVAFYNGVLELMSPSLEHERYSHFISYLITILVEELNLDFANLGSTTLKQKEILHGIEPDLCFYIQNEALIRGKDKIDLSISPPPDLAVEIDLSNSSVDKFSIYAGLGIPELWRYSKKQLFIYHLENAAYTLKEQSLNFPFLQANVILKFIDKAQNKGQLTAGREFRNWVKEQIASSMNHTM